MLVALDKGPEWSDAETIQLCRSWLEISEDPVVGTEVVRHPEKKLQPEVTKFCGVYAKVKSRERSGWSEEMYLEAALKIYADRHKQQFEFLAAWKELKDTPKWTSKITSNSDARAKRKAGGEGDVARPEGGKAAKAERQKSSNRQSAGDDAHLRFVAATEKKAEVME